MKYLEEIYCANLNNHCYVGGFFAPGIDTVWERTDLRSVRNKFYYITKGQCRIKIAGKMYHAVAGDWFYIPCGTVHAYSRTEGCVLEKYWIHFDLYPNLFGLLNLPYKVNAENNQKVLQLFQEFTEASTGNLLTDRLTVKAKVFELLSEYIKLANPQGIHIRDQNDERLEKLLEYINDNLDKNITNDELAGIVPMHLNAFGRYFKEKVGDPPAKYIFAKKMEKVKKLLEESNMPISDIMEKIGIHDASHFCKMFKAYYGMSPKRYREYYRHREECPPPDRI
ncbi:MAG: AraC family transcriptional regulator [Lachnospiraceae bacterium]|nr:AraC family transcriptional regulator [Lachnospiraceae bacterium]